MSRVRLAGRLTSRLAWLNFQHWTLHAKMFNQVYSYLPSLKAKLTSTIFTAFIDLDLSGEKAVEGGGGREAQFKTYSTAAFR